MTHMRNHQGLSNRKRAKSESGFVLISSYILMAGLLTAVFSYFSRSFYDFNLAQRRLSRLQALYTAESGAERAMDWMKTTIPVLQPDCGQANPDTETPYSSTSLGTEGTYTVRITNDCNQPNRIYWIRSTGTFDGIIREVRVSVRLDNLANYALASDQMDPDTYFHQAGIYGPLHINGPIQIYGYPVFFGRVTSSASEVYYYNNDTASDGYTATGGEGTTTIFGREATASRPSWHGDPPYPHLNQPRILFPPADVSNLKRRPGTQVLNQKMWIRFNGDGTYNYSTTGPVTAVNPGFSRSMPPKGGVLYFEPTAGPSSTEPAVVVRGTIDRDITIASTQDIGIDGNLAYECHKKYANYFLGAGANLCSASDPKLTVVSAKNIVHLPEGDIDPAMRDSSGRLYRINHRILSGAYIALGGGMTVSDPSALRYSMIGERKRRWVNYEFTWSQLRVFGTLIEHELKPKSILMGGYQAWSELYKEKAGFDALTVHHDNRLDLASLPPSMRQAMSIVSWEACDGTCT